MAAKKWGNWIEHEPLRNNTGQGDTFLVCKEGDAERKLFVLKQMKSKGLFGNRVERLRNEILAGMQLAHPNIIRVIDQELERSKPFIVTEYCAGGALSPAALRGRTLLERLDLFRGICNGVAYAHREGVIHRDLKPDNIFLQGDGTPVVGDFGLCYFLDGELERVTNLAEEVGARGYMAPECEGGRVLTVLPSADVYSLGKILYWILTGRHLARESQRERENNLAREPSDFEMRLVYDLLDKTVVETAARRLPDAGAVVAKLDTITQRIAARRRAVELARRPLSLAGPQEVKIASFRRGGLPDWRSIYAGPARVLGFAGRGQVFVAWGIGGRGENEGACLVWTGGPHGGWEARSVEVSNPSARQGAGHHALCVDDRGGTLPVVGAPRPDEIATAYLVRLRPGAPATVEVFAEKVGAPQNCAVATGPGGRTAAYFGSLDAVVPDAMGLTIVRSSDKEERHHFTPHTSFPGPLAIAADGTLHQAVVVSVPAGKHEVRELRYLCKPPRGAWAETVVDSTAAQGVSGEIIPEGSMSASIHLNLTPAGHPVILASPKHKPARGPVVYVKEGVEFKQHTLDMEGFAKSVGLVAPNTHGAAQVLFDEEGYAHLALQTNEDDSPEVIYLAADEEWRVADLRIFPTSTFLGMGIDSWGGVHIAMR
jgi:hypothetical protein